MESKSIKLWQEMCCGDLSNNSAYVNYFKFEKAYLENKLKTNDTVLDIGIGTGRTIGYLANKSANFIGIDNDKNAIKIAKQNLKTYSNVDILEEDAENMSFKSSIFDKVFNFMTFSNFGSSQYNILSEIQRVMKDNGEFIFSIYNEFALDERLKYYNKSKLHTYNFDKTLWNCKV